ncbi:acylphosphatase [bacterium]|nr:acylphosphatase [bacterium]
MPAEDNRKRMHALVEGRVQGVGFRHFVLQRVRPLPVKGWVRNLHDGRVEVVAEGEENDLQVLRNYLEQGPPASVVDNVRTEWSHPQGDLHGFDVKY